MEFIRVPVVNYLLLGPCHVTSRLVKGKAVNLHACCSSSSTWTWKDGSAETTARGAEGSWNWGISQKAKWGGQVLTLDLKKTGTYGVPEIKEIWAWKITEHCAFIAKKCTLTVDIVRKKNGLHSIKKMENGPGRLPISQAGKKAPDLLTWSNNKMIRKQKWQMHVSVVLFCLIFFAASGS